MMFNRLKKDKEINKPLYLYSRKELKQYDKFIIDNFGKYNEVFHEIVSPDIHLDIIIIPPTIENNYYKLITMGMGAYKMNVPKKYNSFEHAELVLYLPPNWNIKSSKEEDYWPIRCLKTLARLPIEQNTWLGYGHTISLDEKNTVFASNTKFCSMILLPVLNNKSNHLYLKLKNKGNVNFYQLFPLYEEELKYKENNGIESLMNLFKGKKLSPIININRENYCKEK